MQGDDDAALVARVVAQQDDDAFGELVHRHQSHVRNFLRKLCRDASFADDLAQDCFLHAWDKIGSYSGRGSFIGWLLKIAYTTFLQAKRKTVRYGEVLGELKTAIEIATPKNEQSDELPDLEKLLDVLEEQERAIMILGYGCGLSHYEIGEATGLPVGTVKSSIHRSKEKIRHAFDIRD